MPTEIAGFVRCALKSWILTFEKHSQVRTVFNVSTVEITTNFTTILQMFWNITLGEITTSLITPTCWLGVGCVYIRIEASIGQKQ
jgi:hypothetical protein